MTLGIWRVSAGSDSAVLKLVGRRAEGHPRWPAADDPAHPYYWCREALAYTSGLLERLHGGLRAPVVRAAVERRDGSIALWLEDVAEPAAWTPERLGEAARLVGRVQAAFAADLPEEPWLSRDWLRAYVLLHGVSDPERDVVLERLAGMQHTLCHHDLHPANVIGAGADVVVDWAYCGLARSGSTQACSLPKGSRTRHSSRSSRTPPTRRCGRATPRASRTAAGAATSTTLAGRTSAERRSGSRGSLRPGPRGTRPTRCSRGGATRHVS